VNHPEEGRDSPYAPIQEIVNSGPVMVSPRSPVWAKKANSISAAPANAMSLLNWIISICRA